MLMVHLQIQNLTLTSLELVNRVSQSSAIGMKLASSFESRVAWWCPSHCALHWFPNGYILESEET
jgi:hypothetical protein